MPSDAQEIVRYFGLERFPQTVREAFRRLGIPAEWLAPAEAGEGGVDQ